VLFDAAMHLPARLASLGFASLSLASLLAPAVAAADPTDAVDTDATAVHAGPTPAPTYDVGFRIGGYGFRREGDPAPGAGWTECRMNGLGVFGDRALRGPLYLEVGVDGYASSTFIEPSPSTDLPIDRISLLISSAIGARTQLTSWLRGYVQLGAGVELTHVSMPYGYDVTIRADKALPEGFFGTGADIKVGRATYVGAELRLLVMGNFNYSEMPGSGQWTTPPASVVFAASPDLAAQGQFYLRRDL
jgi:hypothetical protein